MWPRRNELMRPADWVEATLRIAAVVVAVLLVPIALAAGKETYTHQLALGQEQLRDRYQAAATLLADTPPGANGATMAVALARWTSPDGTERTGTVPALSGSRAGQPVAIWLDREGNLATEPITHEDAAMAGLAAGMGLWIVSAAGLCVLYLTARTLLNRRRVTAWQRDWARVAPNWTHPT